MENRKQSNLTPEQVKTNLAQAKHSWYLNNKDRYKPGGQYYACLRWVMTCSCGQEVSASKIRRHQRTKKHLNNTTL